MLTEIFELEASPEEGPSLHSKNNRRKKETKIVNFCAYPRNNVIKCNARGKKGMLSCCKSLFEKMGASLAHIQAENLQNVQKNAYLAKGSMSQWANVIYVLKFFWLELSIQPSEDTFLGPKNCLLRRGIGLWEVKNVRSNSSCCWNCDELSLYKFGFLLPFTTSDCRFCWQRFKTEEKMCMYGGQLVVYIVCMLTSGLFLGCFWQWLWRTFWC